VVAPTDQMTALGFTTSPDISNGEFQSFQTIIDGLDLEEPTIAAALGTGAAPVTPAAPVPPAPGTGSKSMAITLDDTGQPAPPAEEPVAEVKSVVKVDAVPVAGTGAQIRAFETTVKTLDNTRRTVTFTDPTDGSVHQVTARQNAILQEMMKFDNDDSFFTDRLRIEKLFAASISDPMTEPLPPADGEDDPEDEPTLPTDEEPDPDNIVGVDTSPGAGGPELLKEFLNSDPDLMLNAVLNRFRDKGSSQVFLRWFRNNFDRFWGEYLGRVAEQALAGSFDHPNFVDWLMSIDTVNAFFADSSVTRASSNNSRFSSFLASRSR